MRPVIDVLYGTVTGNAEEIARRIHATLLEHDLPQGALLGLADYAKLPSFAPGAAGGISVVVVSTTGEGDPPETIRPFMRLLRKKDPKRLSNLSYAVLGLGDTNYENFCGAGKRVDNGLKKMGARSLYKRGDADDGVGLELVVEPWLDGLWKALEKTVEMVGNTVGSAVEEGEKVEALEASGMAELIQKEESEEAKKLQSVVKKVTVEELGFDEAKLPKVYPPKIFASALDAGEAITSAPLSVSYSYSADVVRAAHITSAKLLTAPDADKAVWHMEVTCDANNKIKRVYRPGDAFGVIVENDAEEVNRFIKAIGAEGDTVLRVVKDTGDAVATASVAQLVKQRLDLRAVPKKALLRCLSDYCADVEERKALLHLCSRDGRKQYTDELVSKNMSIVQVLEQKAQSCCAPFSLFLDQLPCIAPRWYSATSSPELDGSSVLQFAFSVIDNGLATNSLARSCETFLDGGKAAPILLIPRESDSKSHFRPPTSLETSYIMIGPGTGVAPFRGFLRERSSRLKRESDSKVGKTMLFFGCRYADKDFLYHEDLEELEDSGVLSSLDVAISRGGPERVYVQDRLQVRSKEVAEIVQDGGFIYVCGDGGGMAQSVHLTIGKILAEFCCEGNEEEGKAMLRTLAEENRYVRDIWYYGQD